MEVMELLYPEDYNRITSRLRNKFSKILSREVVDIDSRRPERFLEGYEGDLQWVINQRKNDPNFTSVHLDNSPFGGIIIYGLDMSHGFDIIFSKCVQPNTTYEQRKTLRQCIGISGQEAIDLYKIIQILVK